MLGEEVGELQSVLFLYRADVECVRAHPVVLGPLCLGYERLSESSPEIYAARTLELEILPAPGAEGC